MTRQIFCGVCDSELDAKADRCPNCGDRSARLLRFVSLVTIPAGDPRSPWWPGRLEP